MLTDSHNPREFISPFFTPLWLLSPLGKAFPVHPTKPMNQDSATFIGPLISMAFL